MLPSPPLVGKDMAQLHAMIVRREKVKHFRRAFEIVSSLPEEIQDEIKSAPRVKSAADLKLHYIEMCKIFPEMQEYVSKPKAIVSMAKVMAE